MKQRLVLAVVAVFAFGSAMAESQWRHAGGMGMRQFVVVRPALAADAETLKQAAREVCSPGRACVVLFWPEGAAVPKKMPMTRAQQRAVIAQYLRNPASGSEELLMKCQAAQPKGSKCLR